MSDDAQTGVAAPTMELALRLAEARQVIENAGQRAGGYFPRLSLEQALAGNPGALDEREWQLGREASLARFADELGLRA